MANNAVLSVFVRLIGDGAKLKAELDSAGSGVRTLRGVVTDLAKAWVSVQAASRFLATGAEYNQAIVSLGVLTGQSGDKLAYMEEKAMSTGKAMGLFAGDVANAMGVIGSEMPKLLTMPDAMNSTTEAALTLAKASRAVGESMSNADAAGALAAGLNQWKAGADQAERFVNVLAAGAKEGSSLISQTAGAMKVAGTTAASANVEFEQFNALIQILAQRQLKGAEAGTQLRNVLLALLTEGDKFEAFGISADSINPKIVGIETALKNLAPILENDAALVEIFGAENINGAKILIDSADAVGELTGKLTGTQTAYEQAAAGAMSFNAQVEAAQNQVKNAAAAIFQQMSPALVGLALEANSALGVLGGMAENFSALLPLLASGRGALSLLTGGYTLLSATLAGAINWTVVFTGALASVQAAASSVIATLATFAAPVAAVVVAVGGLIAIYSAYKAASDAAAEADKRHSDALAGVKSKIDEMRAAGQEPAKLLEMNTQEVDGYKQNLVSMLSQLEGAKMGMEALSEASFLGFGGPDPEVYYETSLRAAELRGELDALNAVMANPDFTAMAELRGQIEETQAAIVEQEQKRVAAVDELERKHTEERKKEEISRRENTIKELENAFSYHQEALLKAIDEEKRYTEQVNNLQREIESEKQSTEDRIREIRRRGMSEAERQADIEAEVAQKILQSKQALMEGDSERAEALARQAQQAAEGLDNEQKAIAGVQAGSQLIIQAKQNEIESAKQAAQAQVDAQQKSIAAMESLAQSIGQATDELEALKDPREIEIKAEISQAENNLAALQDKLAALRDKTVTVTVQTVEAKAGGGVAGEIPGYFTGAKLPGYSPDKDNLLASLRGSPIALAGGEWVVNARNSRIADNLLRFVNGAPESRLREFISAIPGFNVGARLPEAVAAQPIQSGAQAVVRFDWTLPTGRGSISGSMEQVNALARALQDLNRGVARG